MRREPPAMQAWVWNDAAGDRCNWCAYVISPCEFVPCTPTERGDEHRVIFLPRTPEGFAKGAAMMLDGTLLGTA